MPSDSRPPFSVSAVIIVSSAAAMLGGGALAAAVRDGFLLILLDFLRFLDTAMVSRMIGQQAYNPSASERNHSIRMTFLRSVILI